MARAGTLAGGRQQLGTPDPMDSAVRSQPTALGLCPGWMPDLPSAAQWQDYLDQKVPPWGTTTGPFAPSLGLGIRMADVLEDPADLWLGNAEYIGRLLDSYQRQHRGKTWLTVRPLAAELLSILEVSLLGARAKLTSLAWRTLPNRMSFPHASTCRILARLTTGGI
jgi:hypothetical protein